MYAMSYDSRTNIGSEFVPVFKLVPVSPEQVKIGVLTSRVIPIDNPGTVRYFKAEGTLVLQPFIALGKGFYRALTKTEEAQLGNKSSN